MSVKSKIQSLISAANAKTGESDATLTDAVQTLVDGYGQGGGGEWTTDGIADGSEPNGDIILSDSVKALGDYALAGRKSLTGVKGFGIATIRTYAFSGTSTRKICFPNALVGQNACRVADLEVAVIKSFEWYNGCYNCKKLIKLDIGGTFSIRSAQNCDGCTALKTIILRANSIAAMSNKSDLNNTPFASGGAGGTIYIPKALYDHLGDGSALDYKAATNWSTIDGYGTITWAKIEGSVYENAYADGTPIPTS